jgi:predicted enzyme related to lactoylglutathione lyase
MNDFQFSSQVTFLYFDDLTAAEEFFGNVLSLPLVMDAGWAKIYQASAAAFVGAVQKGKGSLEDTGNQGVLVSFTTNDVFSYREKLMKKTPVSELKEFTDIGLRSFFIEGPEGYSFEIQQFLNDQEKAIF